MTRINSWAVIDDDPYLSPFRSHLDHRYAIYKNWIQNINEHEGGLDTFTKGYQKMGMIVSDTEIIYREWAPGVDAAFLIGEFSNFVEF
jgi:1,4-alpha-glucan branching enzyme